MDTEESVKELICRFRCGKTQSWTLPPCQDTSVTYSRKLLFGMPVFSHQPHTSNIEGWPDVASESQTIPAAVYLGWDHKAFSVGHPWFSWHSSCFPRNWLCFILKFILFMCVYMYLSIHTCILKWWADSIHVFPFGKETKGINIYALTRYCDACL